MFTTRPQPRSYMCGNAPRTSRNGVSSISRRMRLNRSTGNSCTGATCCRPALFTRTSTSRSSASTASRSARSTPTALPPTAAATACAPSVSRSTTTTCAPSAASRSAQARPIPEAPPVTIARRPASAAVMSGRVGRDCDVPHVHRAHTARAGRGRAPHARHVGGPHDARRGSRPSRGRAVRSPASPGRHAGMTEDAGDPRTPIPADRHHLDQRRAATDRAAASAEPLSSPHAGAPEELLARAEQAIEAARGELLGLSQDLHAHPEEGYAEHRSVRAVADLLAAHGIDAQVGVHGLDTALRASTGSDGPTVAVLAEYDALPGIGHGCGHNVICSSAVGAFLGLHAVLSDGGVPGTAVLLGTPAEEGGGGKEVMARDGAVDGVDAVVMLHPFSYDAAVQPFLGRRQLRVTYTGI